MNAVGDGMMLADSMDDIGELYTHDDDATTVKWLHISIFSFAVLGLICLAVQIYKSDLVKKMDIK